MLIVDCVDLEQLEYNPYRAVPQEGDRLVPTHYPCLPQHCPTLRAFYSCQLVLRVYHASLAKFLPYHVPLAYQFCSISRILGSILPISLQLRLRCPSPCRVCRFWFLLAHHDAPALSIPGCFDPLPFRPRSCGSVFCILSDLAADHIHPHRCWLQYVLHNISLG